MLKSCFRNCLVTSFKITQTMGCFYDIYIFKDGYNGFKLPFATNGLKNFKTLFNEM